MPQVINSHVWTAQKGNSHAVINHAVFIVSIQGPSQKVTSAAVCVVAIVKSLETTGSDIFRNNAVNIL